MDFRHSVTWIALAGQIRRQVASTDIKQQVLIRVQQVDITRERQHRAAIFLERGATNDREAGKYGMWSYTGRDAAGLASKVPD